MSRKTQGFVYIADKILMSSRYLKILSRRLYSMLLSIGLLAHSPLLFGQMETDFSSGGALRIGDSTTTCDSSAYGAIRFNDDSGDTLDYCTSSGWLTLLTSSIGGTIVNNGNSFAVPMIIGTNDNNSLSFETNGVTAMTIGTSGNVGVGTTAPGANLHVYDNSGGPQIRIAFDAADYFDIERTNAKTFFQSSNSNASFVMADSGMFGGGDTDPDAHLEVSANGTTGGAILYLSSDDDNDGDIITVLENGNVGIGTSVPAAKLEVVGEVRTVSSTGAPRLWGQGRVGTVRYGTSGAGTGLCTLGSVAFGLSYSAVSWEGADMACPDGTWVCTAAERGTASCDTARPDHVTNDGTSCDGNFINYSSSNHQGWVSDIGGYTNSGFTVTEDGSTDNSLLPCNAQPAWCCSDIP